MKNEVQLASRQNLKDGFYVVIIIHIEAAQGSDYFVHEYQ